jgi:hypothetical protein
MGKKRGQGNTQQALQRQVTQIQINAMKPFVEQQVIEKMRVVEQNLARNLLSYKADVLVRTSILEDIVMEKLNYTRDDLNEFYTIKEDEAAEVVKVDRAAQEGDTVLITLSAKASKVAEGEKEPTYGPESTLRVKDLLKEGATAPFGRVEVSEALKGMSVGDVKELSLQDINMVARIQLDRVTEPKTDSQVED